MTNKLNANELKVLTACKQQIIECTGNEFGYMEDVDRGEFTKPQFAGYVGQLVQKGMITPPDTDGFNGQFKLKWFGVVELGLTENEFDFVPNHS